MGRKAPAPVARLKRSAIVIGGSDGKNRRQSGRHVQAFTALVACRCYHQAILLRALAYRIGEEVLRLAPRRQFSTANIDDMRTMLEGQSDRPRQVRLAAWRKFTLLGFRVDRYHDPATSRRHTSNRSVVLAKDDAGNVRSVCRPWQAFDRCSRCWHNLSNHRTGKTRM